MSSHFRVLLPLCLGVLLSCLGPAFAAEAVPADGKIGIFDLKAIRAVPLDVEILKTTEDGNAVTEELRFTSRPGVRVFAYLSYPKGGKKCPVMLSVRNYGAETRKADARQGFIGFSIAAPCGNTDPAKKDSLGGVIAEKQFADDPDQSWVYQHVVALIRALDYLQTRPEADMKRVLIMGYSNSGFVTALLHALDNRPCAFITWHGTGYYADEKGISGDKTSLISRKWYEMYAPSAYAQYGTQPIFLANSLTDYYATLDGTITMYNKLRCQKVLAFAPNRYHANTSRNEYRGSAFWQWRWQGDGPEPPKVSDGKVAVKDGKLIYSFQATFKEEPLFADVMYSVGKPGRWTGRTWHRVAAKREGTTFSFVLPVYDPAQPLYVLGQLEWKTFGAIANIPIFVEPAQLGITQPTADYPTTLFDFEDQSDVYVANGTTSFVPDAQQGKFAAKITPFQDGTIHLMNFEAFLWKKGAKEIRLWMKGDGKPGPVTVYLTYDTNYWLDKERKNFTAVTLVDGKTVFPSVWKEYVVPLAKVANLEQVDSVYIEPGDRDLMIDNIRVQ